MTLQPLKQNHCHFPNIYVTGHRVGKTADDVLGYGKPWLQYNADFSPEFKGNEFPIDVFIITVCKELAASVETFKVKGVPGSVRA